MSNSETPQFFGSNSTFANKADLVASSQKFCVIDVTDTDTVYGQKWFIQIFVDGEDEFKTLTFGHSDPGSSKREQEFIQLAAHPEYLPVHACTLKKWTYEGKSGYKIVARSGAGPCPCTPEQPSHAEHEALTPWDDDQPVAPAPKATATTLDNQPASPRQYATIGKLSGLLNVEPDMPETFGEAAQLIEQLEADYKRQVASLNKKPELKVVNSVPMR